MRRARCASLALAACSRLRRSPAPAARARSRLWRLSARALHDRLARGDATPRTDPEDAARHDAAWRALQPGPRRAPGSREGRGLVPPRRAAGRPHALLSLGAHGPRRPRHGRRTRPGHAPGSSRRPPRASRAPPTTWRSCSSSSGRAGRSSAGRGAAPQGRGRRDRATRSTRSACSTSRAAACRRDAAEAARWFERAGTERQPRRRGRVRDPALQRRGRSGERGRAARNFRSAADEGQRHRPEPPGAPLRRRAAACRRTRSRRRPGTSLAAAQGLADPWLDDALKDLPRPSAPAPKRLALQWRSDEQGCRDWVVATRDVRVDAWRCSNPRRRHHVRSSLPCPRAFRAPLLRPTS